MRTKRKPHKLLSLLLCCVMLVGMMPMTAAPAYAGGGVATSALYINYSDGSTTTVDAANDANGAGWSYSAATATLTLDGFNGSYIGADGDLNIILKGTNRIMPIGTNQSAIKATGVITIDKNSDDETDKLIIENNSLNTAPFTAIDGSGSGMYGDVLQRGGTVEIELTNNINCSDSYFKGSMDYTVSGNANLKIDINNTVGGMIAAQYLKVSDSADVDITAKATAENKNVTAVEGLKVDGTGQVKITATATGGTATAIVVNNYGDIEPKNGGKVTVTGRVKTDYSSAYYYQPAGDTVVVNPAAQVRKSVGYGGTYCCDASGNPIESMTFTGTDNVKQQMQFNGESLFAIPEGTVGAFIGTHSLCEGISGRAFAYFKLVEGSALPDGITLNENGQISGTPTAECEAGSVQIEARKYKEEEKNTDIDKVVFTIQYGKVVNPPKYLTIDTTQYDMANNASGTNWNYSATDNTLMLNGFSGTYIASDKEINIKLIGTNTITPSNDNKYAIKAYGVITIDKNSNDETDKLTIENSSLNTALFTAIDGSGSGRYGDVLQRGGTVEIKLTNSANCGDSNFKGSMDYTVSGNANLKIDIKNTVGGMIAAQYLKVSDSADVDITATATAENKSVTAVEGLKVDSTGQVKITATATGGTATAIVVNNYGDIEPKNGGKVIVTGRVKTDYSSAYYYQPAGDTVIVDPVGQIRKSVGSGGTYCCDASGNPIESMTFTGTDNVKQKMQFNGESLFAIPDSTVGNFIGTHSLCEGISGRAFAYFKLVEGQFPNGITLNENGQISGTPTAECDAGTVQIEARRYKEEAENNANDKVVFTIQYGAVTVSKPVTGVALDETELILNRNEQKSLSASVQPEDATISTVSWNSDNSSIASVNAGVVTGHNPGKATVTVTTTQGAKTAQATVYVKEEKPNASIDYINRCITNLVKEATYTISGTGITTETFTASGSTYTIKDEWFDKTVSLVRTNTEDKCNSDVQTLTIEKIEPQMLSFAQTSVSKTYGDEPFTNAVTNKTTDGALITDGGNIEWSSSDQNVAIVDGSGKVTIKKAGTTEIKAKAYAKGKYAEGFASYTLTVDKADPTVTAPAGLTGTKGNVLSTVTLPTGWAWKAPTTVMNATGSQTFAAIYTPSDTTNYNTKEVNLTVNVTESSSGGSGGTVTPPAGGGLIPAVQEPDITIIGSGKATLSTDGSTADITADEGYELVSITLNGKEIANTDKLTGLKTGDKVVITFQKKSEEPTVDTKTIVDKVGKMKLTARSAKTTKKNIKITVNTDKETNNLIKEIKDLGYTVKYKYYRSTKKASKYTAKVEKDADINSYINTSGKKGTKYYYKVRVMVYDADGNLVAKSDLKQCKYAARTWSK